MPYSGRRGVPYSSGACTCLPRGWKPLSVGSHTFTSNLWLLPFQVKVLCQKQKDHTRLVTSCFFTVNPHSGLPIACLKIQEYLLVFPAYRYLKVPFIPQVFIFRDLFLTPDNADSTGDGTSILPSHSLALLQMKLLSIPKGRSDLSIFHV